MQCGGDWSGKTRDDVFVFALAALPDAEKWYERTLEIRQQLGIARHMELHAHGMTEHQRFVFLQAASDEGMIVGAIILRKDDALNKGITHLFDYAYSAQELFRTFSQRYCVQRLWYDEEIKGKAAQRAFETELYRMHRANHDKETMKAKCRRSHTSDMVQLADVTAYVLRRHALNTLKNASLHRVVQEIIGQPRNLIIRR